MKNKKMFNKKLSLAASLILASFGISSGGFADQSQNTAAITNAIGSAVTTLKSTIIATSSANVKNTNNNEYQQDAAALNLPNINPSNASILSQLAAMDTNKTGAQVQNSLLQVSNAALTYNVQTPAVKEALQQLQDETNKITNLTTNLPGSDTLYTAVQGMNGVSTGNILTKPTTVYDAYFNFDTLFAPTAYTVPQQQAAWGYLTFLSKRYLPVTAGIDFGPLVDELNKYKFTPLVLGQKLQSLVTSAAFISYQLSLRSLMAAQSLGLSNMNYLINERTPLESTLPNAQLAQLSQQVGVTPTQVSVPNYQNSGKTVKVWQYASPLQISNYIHQNRVSNPAWYQQMQTASPAVVQRETLFVLAEIESQMQQQHLDNERILATLTAQELSANTATSLQMQATALNSQIQSLSSSSSSGSGSDSGS